MFMYKITNSVYVDKTIEMIINAAKHAVCTVCSRHTKLLWKQNSVIEIKTSMKIKHEIAKENTCIYFF